MASQDPADCPSRNPELVSEGSREASPPNIILVSLDTLRARSLGLYGHVRDTMPSLDEMVGG